jgi:hypothetical protein
MRVLSANRSGENRLEHDLWVVRDGLGTRHSHFAKRWRERCIRLPAVSDTQEPQLKETVWGRSFQKK